MTIYSLFGLPGIVVVVVVVVVAEPPEQSLVNFSSVICIKGNLPADAICRK